MDKGAAGIGAAEGRGQVYERGVLVGTAKLTQVTVGAQFTEALRKSERAGVPQGFEVRGEVVMRRRLLCGR